ncbi:MAG: serine hydrolase domain-containing protein [Caldilineales bacterium]
MNRIGKLSTDRLADSLEEAIPKLMEEATVPGVAITLVREGTIAWSRAFGVRNRITQEPVTLDTVFEAASLSKPLFAYVSLKLCDRGILDLDTPVVDYIPECCLTIALPTPGDSREKLVIDKAQLALVTTRHLLSHTAGYPNWPSKEQPLKTYFVPGERFAYSGTGYSILQSIVETVTDQTAIACAQQNVLEPLGMENSRFVWAGTEDLQVALGHNEAGTPTEKASWPEMIAGASLHCTATDFAKFVLAVMRPSPDNPYHLSSDLTKEMLTPQVKTNDSATWHVNWPNPETELFEQVSWGLGWGIQHLMSDDSFWHWGDNGNYQNFVIGSAEEGAGIVIMTNGKNGKQVYQRILRGIIGGEYPSLDWLMSL